MNNCARLIADNLDREDGLPTKAIVHLPEGRLTPEGFRTALRQQTRTEVITTTLKDGSVAVARKYIREIVKLLNQVYPHVDIDLTFDGRFHQCHVNCQKAEGPICECKCLYLFHSGGGLPGIVVDWSMATEDGVLIGHEESKHVQHSYTNEGLPEGGNDLYYMARIFEGLHEKIYLKWYEEKVNETEEIRVAKLRNEVTTRVNKEIGDSALTAGIGFNKLRFRIALVISKAGYGTLRKATFGVRGNAEEIIVNYIIDQHDGDVDAALEALAGKAVSA